MANKNWNKHTAPSNEQGKSQTRKTQEPSKSRPKAEQVESTRPKQKPLGEKFKSKKEMIDTL